jgi:hypothetical protein
VKLKERIALWFAEREFRKQAVRFLEKTLGRPLTRKEKSAMKNWKTTCLGILAGLTGGTVTGWMTPEGKIHWGAVALAVITSLFGYFAKDHDDGGVI